MSEKDVQAYRVVAESFVGRRVFVSVLTNTLKLIMDSRHAGPEFLWIDPPWALLRGQVVIVSAESYPSDHEAPDSGERFKAWAALAGPLEGVTFERIGRSSDGSVEFHFSGDLRLVVPTGIDDLNDDSWYDHWYARGLLE
jgi:hypothetical protein